MEKALFWILFVSTMIGLVLFTNVDTIFPQKPDEPVEYPKEGIVSKILELKPEDYEQIYLNEFLKDKFTNSPELKVLLGLGNYSGPKERNFQVREESKQVALQKIIELLESQIKEYIREKLPERYLGTLDIIFDELYVLLNDTSLGMTPTFSIWKKETDELIYYGTVIIFDYEIAQKYIVGNYSNFIEELKNEGIDFEKLWLEAVQKVKDN